MGCRLAAFMESSASAIAATRRISTLRQVMTARHHAHRIDGPGLGVGHGRLHLATQSGDVFARGVVRADHRQTAIQRRHWRWPVLGGKRLELGETLFQVP
jgi:hypothetical protein